MPRKAKAFKTRRRDAAKAAGQGNWAEANKLWLAIAADRKKLKDEKAAKRAAKKAPKAAE